MCTLEGAGLPGVGGWYKSLCPILSHLNMKFSGGNVLFS